MTDAIETREGLSVTELGRVGATLRHFGSSRATLVLARLGLSADRWSAAQAAWDQAIEEDAEGARLGAWNEAFEAAKEDLAARKPDVDEIAPIELRVTSAPAPVPVPVLDSWSLREPTGADPSPWAAMAEGRKRAPAMTQVLDPKAAPPAVALPFKPGSGAPAPVDPRPSEKRAPVSTGTTDVDERKLLQAILPFGLPAPPAGAPLAEALPALSPSPAPAGPYTALTLEQYASLLAELATFPDRSREIRAKYFVPSDMLLGALHASFHERLRDDPALMERFQQLYTRYRAWLVAGLCAKVL